VIVNQTSETMKRRLLYRLQRQGMLELDVWLNQLTAAIQSEDTEILQAVETLMACESPDLLAMQTGELSIPEVLKPWLNI